MEKARLLKTEKQKRLPTFETASFILEGLNCPRVKITHCCHQERLMNHLG